MRNPFWMAVLVPTVYLVGTHDACVSIGEQGPPKGPVCRKLHQEANQLASLIGQEWGTVWAKLSKEDMHIVQEHVAEEADKHSEYILRAGNGFANVRILVNKKGRIDEVEAWQPDKLRPLFETVVGEAAPGVAVERIEKVYGEPMYVEHFRHSPSMRGWLIDDYLVFVESTDGLVHRVYAFRRDSLPPASRMWSHKSRSILKSLAKGEKDAGKAL